MCQRCIEAELRNRNTSVTVIHLRPDIAGAAGARTIIVTAAAAIPPGNDVTAACQTGYGNLILVIGNKAVINTEIIDDRCAVSIKLLGINIVAAATIVATVIFPGNNEAAVIQSGNRRQILRV